MNKRQIKELFEQCGLHDEKLSELLYLELSRSLKLQRKVTDISKPVGFLETRVTVCDSNPQAMTCYCPVFAGALGGIISPLDMSPDSVTSILQKDTVFASTIDLPKRSDRLVDTVTDAFFDGDGRFQFNALALTTLATPNVLSLPVTYDIDDYVKIQDDPTADAVLSYHADKYEASVSIITKELMHNPKVAKIVKSLTTNKENKNNNSIFPI